MSERGTTGRREDSRGPAHTPDRGEDTPLADFPWSDEIVGMGYFPDEVGLPPAWSWAQRSAR